MTVNDMAAVLRDHGVTLPPTQDELPYDDGMPLETERHRLQIELLIDTLGPWLAQRPHGGYAGGNMFVYFSLQQTRGQDFRGPDMFVVLDVPPRERKSWVIWEEGKGPDIVIELLSESTAEQDKTTKKLIYQNQLRVPEYFWYDPFDPRDWAGFTLHDSTYDPLQPDPQGRLVSNRLGLALVRWTGVYKGVGATWLRWASLDDGLLPTGEELALQQAEQERKRAEQERERAEREYRRAERLAARLRELGVEPEDL
ncbi:MAG: Uma2 family endonuclease [Candidatus Competibacteraceae bacterium]